MNDANDSHRYEPRPSENPLEFQRAASSTTRLRNSIECPLGARMILGANTPQSVLDYWLGPLREVRDSSDDAWRERMIKWRAGAFATGKEDLEFCALQRKICDDLHRAGPDQYFASPAWTSPRGRLAKIIIMDQFPRAVYRGTPLAFEHDDAVATLAQEACTKDWDAYTTMERTWICVALSHCEDSTIQCLSIQHAALWRSELVEASTADNLSVNTLVGAAFIETADQHAGAVQAFGRFPHRNSVLCRRHEPQELFYLLAPNRPGWSYTQPPRPLYYAMHAALHRATDVDCKILSRESLQTFHDGLVTGESGLDGALTDVFDVLRRDHVTFDQVYKHYVAAESGASHVVQQLVGELTEVIYEDPSLGWPPRNAKKGVPQIIDVDAMIRVQGCPYLKTVGRADLGKR